MSTWLHCGDVNGARVEFTVHMEGGSSGSGRMTLRNGPLTFGISLVCMRIMKAHECRIGEVNCATCQMGIYLTFVPKSD